MILFGKNIISSGDVLTKVPIVKIFHALKNPKSETIAQIRQLRIVRKIDIKRYNTLKRQLPYFVCGIFTPPLRKSENFAYIEYFILDIDKITEKGLSVQDLRQKIEKDNRVLLCFISPSEDGIKILFKLKERCYDKGIFSLFYKTFAQQFARQYNIEQVIDNQTCDVTRACFVSIDPQAYYNPNAATIEIEKFLQINNPTEMFDIKHQFEIQEKEYRKEIVTPASEKVDVDDEVIRNVKMILNPKLSQKEEKKVYIPEQLTDIMEELQKYITATGIQITEIINISYGKKIRMKSRTKQAEVNVFYGKRGFSVVKSPRSGTNEELNELMASLIQSFFDQN